MRRHHLRYLLSSGFFSLAWTEWGPPDGAPRGLRPWPDPHRTGLRRAGGGAGRGGAAGALPRSARPRRLGLAAGSFALCPAELCHRAGASAGAAGGAGRLGRHLARRHLRHRPGGDPGQSAAPPGAERYRLLRSQGRAGPHPGLYRRYPGLCRSRGAGGASAGGPCPLRPVDRCRVAASRRNLGPARAGGRRHLALRPGDRRADPGDGDGGHGPLTLLGRGRGAHPADPWRR